MNPSFLPAASEANKVACRLPPLRGPEQQIMVRAAPRAGLAAALGRTAEKPRGACRPVCRAGATSTVSRTPKLRPMKSELRWVGGGLEPAGICD